MTPARAEISKSLVRHTTYSTFRSILSVIRYAQALTQNILLQNMMRNHFLLWKCLSIDDEPSRFRIPPYKCQEVSFLLCSFIFISYAWPVCVLQVENYLGESQNNLQITILWSVHHLLQIPRLTPVVQFPVWDLLQLKETEKNVCWLCFFLVLQVSPIILGLKAQLLHTPAWRWPSAFLWPPFSLQLLLKLPWHTNCESSYFDGCFSSKSPCKSHQGSEVDLLCLFVHILPSASTLTLHLWYILSGCAAIDHQLQGASWEPPSHRSLHSWFYKVLWSSICRPSNTRCLLPSQLYSWKSPISPLCWRQDW